MTEAPEATETADALQAEISEKRDILAALKAVETNVVLTGALVDVTGPLKDEITLLDEQINDQLNVIAGHASIPSNALKAAKAQVLDLITKQVDDSREATAKAIADAQASDLKTFEEAANEAAVASNESSQSTASQVDALLNVPVPEVPQPPVNTTVTPPADTSGSPVVPTPPADSSDSSAGTLPTPPAPTPPADAAPAAKPVYTHVGGNPIDATAWPSAGTTTAAGEPLYNFSGDTDATPTGASAEWVVYTDTQKGA